MEAGRLRLLLEIGSRRWGGSTWELDLSIGAFDVDLGEFNGSITWELRRHTGQGGHEASADRQTENAILDLLNDCLYELTRTAIVEKVGDKATRTRAVLERLEQQKRVVWERLTRVEGGKKRTRTLLGLAYHPVPDGEGGGQG